ncbi:MAG: Fe-S cluster assembly protein SufD [Candidatus Velthaea sp.]
MASLSPAPAVASLPFAASAATLERVIAVAGDTESAVGAERRREAFARYTALPAPGGHPGRTWRYNYDKLALDDVRWSSGCIDVPAAPARELAPDDPDTGQPALETGAAGGLAHLGALVLRPERTLPADPRITVVPLAGAARMHDEVCASTHLHIADWRGDRFAALSVAFQNCGAFVYVPEGVVLDAPIQLLFAANEAETAAIFPHVVVVLGAGARATVIERFGGAGDAFVSGIVEAHVGPNAELDYVAVQRTDAEARIFFSRAGRCEHDAVIRWHLAELGGALARSVIDTRLSEPGARAETGALFFTGAMQHVDLTTQTDHAVGPTFSDTVVRSAATDRGQGRFFGNIVIRAQAHGADAALRDDALLLSKHAHIDSVPALEIAANDVKAFHGATVGSLDDETLFYALSRGIARADALRMIALGFFEPAIARFPGERLRDEVRAALDEKIDEATEIDA